MARNPMTEKVRGHLRKMIKEGKIPPVSECECSVCGTSRKKNPNVRMEYHHEDYSKPNEVIAVCGKCHTAIHIANGTKFQKQSEVANTRWSNPESRERISRDNQGRFKKGS